MSDDQESTMVSSASVEGGGMEDDVQEAITALQLLKQNKITEEDVMKFKTYFTKIDAVEESSGKQSSNEEKFKFECDRKGNTALILAAKTLDLKLIMYFLDKSNYASDDDAGERVEGDGFIEQLCLHQNSGKENALTAALRKAIKKRSTHDEVIQILEIFSGIYEYKYKSQQQEGANGEMKPNRSGSGRWKRKDAKSEELLRKMITEKNRYGMNVLHTTYATKYDDVESEKIHKTLLTFLQDFEIKINPFDEDCSSQKLTPFLYLMRECEGPRTNLEKEVKVFIDYCKIFDSFDPQKLLRNSIGIDIVHMRSSSRNWKCSLSDFFEPKDIPQNQGSKNDSQESRIALQIPMGLHKKVLLYDSKSPQEYFHNQIILGGPVKQTTTDVAQNCTALHFACNVTQNWTALHFACKAPPELITKENNIRFLVDKGFSLSDVSTVGHTCVDLAENKDFILRRALDIHSYLAKSESEDDTTRESNQAQNQMQRQKRIASYISGIDPINCALDKSVLSKQNYEHREHIDLKLANAKLKQEMKKLSKETATTGFSEEEFEFVKAMWLCFEDDRAELFRYLLHSSLWKKYEESISCAEQNLKQKKVKQMMEYFFEKHSQTVGQKDVPVLGHHRIKLKNDYIGLNRISKTIDDTKKPKLVLKYLENGTVFLYQLLKPNEFFYPRSLIELAVRTGRPKMAKALLLTRQFDLIPQAVHTILVCDEMIEKDHMLNFYPVMDVNNDLKSVRAFASRVAMNAINFLYHGSKKSEARLIFNYLKSKGKNHSAESVMLPRFGLKTFKLKQGEPVEEKCLSILDLVRKTGKEEFYTTECFQQLSMRMWNVYKNDEKEKKEGKGTFLRFVHYIRAPKRKLMLYTISALVFIGMLIASLTFPAVNLNWVDIVQAVFLISFVTVEVHEALVRTKADNFKSYIFDIWNIYDWLIIIFLLAALSLKLGLFFTGQVVWGYLDDVSRLQILGQPFITYIFNYKMLISTTLILASTTFLKLLRFHKVLGINLVVLPKIFINDLMPFTIIILVFIAAFGSIFLASLTMGRASFDSTGTIVRRTDDVLYDIYTRTVMAAFGEYLFDSIDDCVGNLVTARDGCYYGHGIRVYKRFLLIVFLLAVNLVMFNMLIAKFSNTVYRFEPRALKIWLATRDEMLIDFAKLTSMPPPFNIIGTIGIFVKKKLKSRRTAKVNDENSALDANQSNKKNNKLYEKLAEFYIFQAEKFSNRRHEMQTRDTETIEDDIREEMYGEESKEFLTKEVPLFIQSKSRFDDSSSDAEFEKFIGVSENDPCPDHSDDIKNAK